MRLTVFARSAVRVDLLLVVLGALLLGFGCGGDKTTAPSGGALPLEHYDAGFFSIDKPKGWTIVTAGSCSDFAFLAYDPAQPMRQIYYFGTVGPVYMSQAQKDLDETYVSHGGFGIPWIDAPVVDPFTPANYLAHWPQIADMAAAAAFMPKFPKLRDLAVIADDPQSAMLSGASTSILRALFTREGAVGEGMFLVSVLPFMPYTGNPGGGNGYGYILCGATMPKTEFPGTIDRLVASLNSFTITDAYVQNCIQQSQQTWGAIAAAGRTLSEASDILWEGWEARTHGEDISAEKWNDGYLGVERVYDPDTGEVYEFPVGWYDTYDLHRGEYDMSGLEPLPGDAWDLWMKAPLDGASNVH
jgi:hypothetical protein